MYIEHFLFTSCVSMQSQLILHAFKNLTYSLKIETYMHVSLWNSNICSITVTCQTKAAWIPLKPSQLPTD